MFKLRDYQDEGVKPMVEFLNTPTKKVDKGIWVAPTGAGKSLYIAFGAKSVDYPVVVLQPNVELLKQNYRKFTDIGGEASIYCVSSKDFQKNKIPYTRIDGEPVPCEEIGHVTYATIGSIMKHWKEFKKMKVGAIIIDECHINTKTASSQIREFIEKVKIKKVVGLTATPIYLQNRGFDGSELVMMNRTSPRLFSKIKHVTQISELVKNKFWSPLVYRSFKPDGRMLKPNSSGSDYSESSQVEFYKANNLNKQIKYVVEKLRKQGKRNSMLIFVPDISSAEELKNHIPNSKVISSNTSTKDRESIIDDFRNLKIDVVINVNILSVGFDHPQLDVIITARPTMSMAVYYQQIGRGVRIHPDKESCAIVDLSGNFEMFGRIETLSFENIEGYGWGMFQGETLLTGVPIKQKYKPTKKSLGLKRESSGYVRLFFGKHEGKTVDQVAKEDRGYLMWMLKDFKAKSDKARILINDIKNYYKL